MSHNLELAPRWPRPAKASPASEGPARRSTPASVDTIKVGLVDDHTLIREGLRMVLASDDGFEVVGEAAGHDEAFVLVAEANPDVILLDLTFPEGDAMPLLRVLRTRYPELRILVLTMHRDPETVRQALLAGASGYLVKGAHSRELFDAIRAVASGERYLHSSVTGAIVDDSIRWLRAGDQLSVREREILSLLAADHSATEMGQLLGISVHTVRRHLANLSAKLGVHGTTALARYAARNGFARET